ncbi:small-conductance mechanosensitive ion channel [Desulfuromonas sp. DDH964]|uniref:mechanosensitive ion channel family protein n=1 Tax=Desulfuromonas sp. DDH964 TaxID=1823759 RepID=UPI00078EA15F|nr:mechanosensitive ion channel family protein [Desulfuromonas sp. DDH964]AMV73470.1 small-conductance mechanosensitive ion channel [Desulfuromonas sp. DDH964]
METLTEILKETFLGITLGRFAAAFAILLFALFLKKVLAQLFARVIFPLAARTRSQYDDLLLAALQKPVEFLVIIAGLFVGVQVLQLPSDPVNLRRFAHAMLKVLVTFDGAWIFFNLVSLVEVYLEKWVSRTESTLDDHLLPFVRKSLRVFIIGIAALMTIQNLGYSISGLLASLGIGGLAVALAAKDTLSNVFGSLMIIMDRPFHIGDWIKAGDLEGTVEEVGFRSTKVRTFAKTLISVPNSVITNMAVDNFSRMPKRRIKLTVGVTYQTTPEQMRRAVTAIRELLGSHPAIDQEFYLVNFTDFGASSLDIMVYCFTTTTVWGEYLDAREDLCLRIMEILEGMGLEIAFPTRTLYLKGKEGDMLPGAAFTKEELPG